MPENLTPEKIQALAAELDVAKATLKHARTEWAAVTQAAHAFVWRGREITKTPDRTKTLGEVRLRHSKKHGDFLVVEVFDTYVFAERPLKFPARWLADPEAGLLELQAIHETAQARRAAEAEAKREQERDLRMQRLLDEARVLGFALTALKETNHG